MTGKSQSFLEYFFLNLRKFNKYKIAILTVYSYLRITFLIVHNQKVDTFNLSNSTRRMSEGDTEVIIMNVII
jgi:hypothetical protein